MTITLNGTTGITNDGGYTGDGVVFADTTPANTLVTTTGGNVGIGTSSPLGKLDLYATSSAIGYVRTANQTLKLTADDSGSRADIANAAGSALSFTIGTTERARIDSSGNLLVGTTTGIEKLTVNGYVSVQGQTLVPGAASTINTNCNGNSYYGIMVKNLSAGSNSQAMTFVNSSNGFVGTIVLSSSTTTYNTSSDYRLKNTIAPMTGALEKVAALKPCTYKWNVDGSDGQGFIAHELAEVCPQAVSGEKDAVNEDGSIKPQGIDTSFLVATLTAAIQEQQAIITDQDVKMGQLVDQLTNAESTMNLLTEMFTESQQTVAALTARVEALEGTQP
jgi:hypothetical protein